MGTLQIRIDDEMKNKAAELYDSMGLDLSSAVRMFLKKSISVNGIPFVPGDRAEVMPVNKKKRYTVSVGLDDKDEKLQKIQTERALRLVTSCCKGYGAAFSSYLQDGGYIHDSGEYVLEKSVCIVFIDPDRNMIEEIAKDLCAFMNQESVLVTVEDIECFSISENLPEMK